MGTLAIFLRDHHPHELRIRRSQLSWHKRQRCGRHRKLRNYYLGAASVGFPDSRAASLAASRWRNTFHHSSGC